MNQQLPRFHVVIPCAGSGSRSGLGGPKQYALLAGEPMVVHTLRALRKCRVWVKAWWLSPPMTKAWPKFSPSTLKPNLPFPTRAGPPGPKVCWLACWRCKTWGWTAMIGSW
ncbi:MAG: 2-C-methyl-D-erythritol 4-phosphate cytidylyltransferase, partial [Limnohabitans sp.]